MGADWLDGIVTAWKGHRAFAEWLVRDFAARRPGGAVRAVDLGVDKGFSTLVLAGAGARVTGVDLFEPDARFGYGDTQAQVQALADAHGLQVELVRADFAAAAAAYAGGPVDVLHIDGTHTYEAVRADFANWSPHLAPDGVVLFHDVCVPEFSVAPFFRELALPKAHFVEWYGLGVASADVAALERAAAAFPALRAGF